MNLRREIPLLVALLVWGCGTVVGNPKKPKDEPKGDSVAFRVPEIELEVPGDATAADSALMLADEAPQSGDKAILTDWASRLDRQVRRVNALSKRVNAILEKNEDEVQDGVLVFKNRGEDQLLSGKIKKLADGGTYGYEATLCYDGKLLSHLLWTEAGDRFELTRDFGVKTASDDDSSSFLSHLTLSKSDKLRVDLETQGQSDANDPEEGQATTESSHIEKDAAGFRVRMVGDFRQGEELPADGAYEGNRYLVGQITDQGAEFVGYRQSMKVACKNGFEEDATDVWHPGAGRPRFCVGRPAGAKKFGTVAKYYETLERLRPIGIQPKANLRAVKFADGLGCE